MVCFPHSPTDGRPELTGTGATNERALAADKLRVMTIKTESGRLKPSEEYDTLLARMYPEARHEEQAPMDAELVRMELQDDTAYLWIRTPAETKLVILPEVLHVRDQRWMHGTRLARLGCVSGAQRCRYRFLSPEGSEVLVLENLPAR